MQWTVKNFGLDVATMSYIVVDYLRHLFPTWYSPLQKVLWIILIIVVVAHFPFYHYWSFKFCTTLPFVTSMLFMLTALLLEAISIQSVFAVLGLDCIGSSYFRFLVSFIFFIVMYDSA
ncbi:hypothetical protein RJT34_08340 [Clitoria ternatea]|uniref:Uncharacterized protein n=1 Tax=Clitoria ternatea TaxID=43366 RepID=A0AAN9PVL8_CLITE